MQENRKFPRLDIGFPGELDFRVTGGERITTPATVTSVSPEGASVALADAERLPARDNLATLRFSYEHDTFTLPARVAWVRPAAGNAEVGLEFLLDQMPGEMGQRYARWIVDRFVKQKRA